MSYRRNRRAVEPGRVRLTAPPGHLGVVRRVDVTWAGLRDRIGRIEPDTEGHTDFTRRIQHEVAYGDVHTALWRDDRTRALTVEGARLEERLLHEPALAAPEAELAPADGASGPERARWAEATRAASLQSAACGAARKAYSSDERRLAEVRAEVALLQQHAGHVRGLWREHYYQEVAIYTRARVGRDSARGNGPPQYAAPPTNGEPDEIALLESARPRTSLNQSIRHHP